MSRNSKNPFSTIFDTISGYFKNISGYMFFSKHILKRTNNNFDIVNSLLKINSNFADKIFKIFFKAISYPLITFFTNLFISLDQILKERIAIFYS